MCQSFQKIWSKTDNTLLLLVLVVHFNLFCKIYKKGKHFAQSLEHIFNLTLSSRAPPCVVCYVWRRSKQHHGVSFNSHMCSNGVGAHWLIHAVANWIIAVMPLTQSVDCVWDSCPRLEVNECKVKELKMTHVIRLKPGVLKGLSVFLVMFITVWKQCFKH